ncbi:MAG: adenosylcobinamide-GDP ribazoletransferase [Treponema sp.]|nr:adenosylcobinamide-GDP ribazoletransferase [Treponema sp.]
MTFINSIFLAFSTFSVLPAPKTDWNEKNMRYMMCAFPFVGLVIAFFCALFYRLSVRVNLPLPLSALIFTFIPIFTSGGIHFDGFMDTIDALSSHASREKKLEILKDSHSGAFAILGCVIYILSFFVFSLLIFAKIDFRNLLVLLSVFFISRVLSAFAVATFPIAKNSGLIHTFSSASHRKFTAVWCLFCLFSASFFAILFGRFLGIALVASSLSVFCWYFVIAVKNFGGITGDTAGFFLQLCELSAVIVFAIASL